MQCPKCGSMDVQSLGELSGIPAVVCMICKFEGMADKFSIKTKDSPLLTISKNPSNITHFIFVFRYRMNDGTRIDDTQVLHKQTALPYYLILIKDPCVENLEVYEVIAHLRCRVKDEKDQLEHALKDG